MNRIKAIALAAGLALTGCGDKLGRQIWKEVAPLTKTLKSDLGEELVDIISESQVIVSHEGVECERETTTFDGPVREFINHFLRFTEEDYGRDGVDVDPLDESITLYLTDISEVHEICGEDTGGCTDLDYEYIVMPECLSLQSFLNVFYHEYGHILQKGNIDEFASEAFEAYAPIKTYQFSKAVGSFLVLQTTPGPSEDIPREYALGRLFAPINLNKRGSDIEQAVEHVTNADPGNIMAYNFTREFGDLRGEYYDLQSDVLLGEEFFRELTGPTGHLSEQEADELISYLNMKSFERFVAYQADEGLEAELEKMEADYEFMTRAPGSNLYFRNSLVRQKTLDDWEELRAVMTDSNHILLEQQTIDRNHVYRVWEMTREILDTNAGYPCEGNIYTCPARFSDVENKHAWALRYHAWASETLWKEFSEDAIQYLAEYATRYINASQSCDEYLDRVRNNSIPALLVPAAEYGYAELLQVVDAVNCIDIGGSIEERELYNDCIRYKGIGDSLE